jgi:hypothetical protein
METETNGTPQSPAELRTGKGARAVGVDAADRIILVTIPEGFRLVARVESGRLDVVPIGPLKGKNVVSEFQLVPVAEDGVGPQRALALVRKDERPGRWALLWAALTGLFRRRR